MPIGARRPDLRAVIKGGEIIVDNRWQPMAEVSRRYGQQIDVIAELDYLAAVDQHCSLFALNASERSMLKPPETIDKLMETLKGLESPTEKHVRLRDSLNETGNARRRLNQRVIRALPSFMYVSSHDRMDGAIQIEEIRQRIANGEIEHDEHRGARWTNRGCRCTAKRRVTCCGSSTTSWHPRTK